MDATRITEALRQASDTRAVVIGTGTLAQVNQLLRQHFGDRPAVVVADENTFAVAGRSVNEYLHAGGNALAEPIIFPATPTLYADFENVLKLEQQLAVLQATPVVVGSGTLNDITKLAAHRVGRQYLCVGTAASMDGYTSFGAAITRDGFKQTMACPAPRVVLADLDVLASAPAQMNATGYGDLLGKITAGADWLLADALDIEPIDQRAWPLVQDSLRQWTGRPDLLRAGDQQTIAFLFEGLIMTGIAMQISISSRPASGSEHRFSHLWEMQALGHGHAVIPHGFKVGIGTLAAAALYERVLARDLTSIDIERCCATWPSPEQIEQSVLQSHDIPQLATNAAQETLAKYITPEQLRQRLNTIQQRWPIIREKLTQQLIATQQLQEMLATAGCPTSLAAIGLDTARLRESYWLARTIRNRYTILDLIYEAGILDDCVNELFAPGGYWAE